MTVRKEIYQEIVNPFRAEKLILEQAGLKELCSETILMSAKRVGREPGSKKWARVN